MCWERDGHYIFLSFWSVCFTSLFAFERFLSRNKKNFCYAGAVRIRECRDGFVDVREDAINDITCDDFSVSDTITWTMKRNGISQDVATCAPSSACTNRSSDVGAVRMAGGNETQLLLQPPDRAVDQFTVVTCTSNKSQHGERSVPCKLNVISMAFRYMCPLCSVQHIRTVNTFKCILL